MSNLESKLGQELALDKPKVSSLRTFLHTTYEVTLGNYLVGFLPGEVQTKIKEDVHKTLYSTITNIVAHPFVTAAATYGLTNNIKFSLLAGSVEAIDSIFVRYIWGSYPRGHPVAEGIYYAGKKFKNLFINSYSDNKRQLEQKEIKKIETSSILERKDVQVGSMAIVEPNEQGRLSEPKDLNYNGKIKLTRYVIKDVWKK